MTAEQQVPTPSPPGLVARYEQSVMDRITDFNDPRQEWRRLGSEQLGDQAPPLLTRVVEVGDAVHDALLVTGDQAGGTRRGYLLFRGHGCLTSGRVGKRAGELARCRF